MRVPFIAFLSALLILVTDFAFVQAGVVPLTTDQRWGLNIQNMGRSSKKLKPLVWDPKLAQDAAAYAKVLARTQKLQHSGVGGENLFYESRGSAPFSDAAKAWMAEKPLYHNEIIPQGNFAAYGHYTQCMWKSTTKVGMGAYKDSKGGIWVVARYAAAGNMVGQRPY